MTINLNQQNGARACVYGLLISVLMWAVACGVIAGIVAVFHAY